MKYMSLFRIFFFLQWETGKYSSESTDPFFLPLRRGSKSCGQIAGPQKLPADQAEAPLALGRTSSLAPAEPSPASELWQHEHLQGISCLQSSSNPLGTLQPSAHQSEATHFPRGKGRNRGMGWGGSSPSWKAGWWWEGPTLAHPVPPWLASGLAVGSEQMDPGLAFSLSQITKPLTAGSHTYCRAFQEPPFQTPPSPVHTRGVSLWSSFDLNKLSPHVISQNKKSFRGRLLH